MVIGEDFVWLHMPKTGGSATRAFLRTRLGHLNGISFEAKHLAGKIPTTHPHHSLAQRKQLDPGFDPAGKRILCGIRRLPSWLLSSIHFHYAAGRDFGVSREDLVRGNFKTDAHGAWMRADQRLAMFDPECVNAWIRLEHMADDMRAAFPCRGPIPRKSTT